MQKKTKTNNNNDFSPKQIEQEVQELEILFTRPELLAHPTLPEPLHGLNPRTIMGKKKWDEVRLKTYAVNNYHCFACGKYAPHNGKVFSTEQKLHAHECYEFDYKSCSATLIEIVALCPLCHDGIHLQRSQALYAKGIIDESYMYAIYSNKEMVLGLDDSSWGKWNLEYKGKKHYSKFKNREEWEGKYNGR